MSRRFAPVGGTHRPIRMGEPGASFPPNPAPAAEARGAAGVSVITQFQAGHGWSLLGGTTGNVNDTAANQAIGTQCAWFQGNGNNTVTGMRRAGAPSVDFTGKDIGFLFRVDEPNNIPATGASFLIYLGNGGFANFLTLSLANDATYKFFPRRNTSGTAFGGSWQYVTIPLDFSTTLPGYASKSGAQTAAQILANVTDYQIYYKDPLSSTPSRISVNEIFSVPKQTTYPNGVCCITFDDGWASAYTNGAPIVQAGSGRATAYVIKEQIGAANYMTRAQLLDLQATYSWKVGCHTYAGTTHVYPGYPAQTPSNGIHDLQLVRAWTKAQGLLGYNHMSYPNGGYCVDAAGVGTADDSCDRVLAPYVKTARTIYNQMPETLPPADRMKLRTYWATSSVTTLAQLKAFVDTVKRVQGVSICVFHELVASAPSGAQWLTSDFQSFVTYLGTIGMPMRTIDEVFV